MTRKDMYILYFAQIYGMQWHPGAGTRGHRPLTLDETDRIVCNMIDRTYIRFDQWKADEQEEQPCHS